MSLTRRGRAALRVAAAVCAGGAAVAAFAALSSSDPAASARSTGPELRTPIFSPRRTPKVFEREATKAKEVQARANLGTELAGTVAPYDACVTVEVDGEQVANIGADHALAPASTLKLLTAIAAVDRLGADHRFRTRALQGNGGELVLIGGGDPLLATDTYMEHEQNSPRSTGVKLTQLAALADAVVASGMRPSAIAVDDSRYDAIRYNAHWKSNYVPDGEIGPVGALSVDGGFADPIARTAANDPALLAGQRLAEALTARGVPVTTVRRGSAPAGAPEVAHVDSAPMSDIVGDELRSSRNYSAEMLVRELAAAANPNQPATTEAGIAVLVRTLDALGVPTAGLVVHDGSGLAPDNRVLCTTLLGAVELSQTKRFKAVDRGLAVAGESGTLIIHFVGEPLAGRLRGKTGSLTGVVGLAGVIDAPVPRRFAFLAGGGFGEATGRELQDSVAEAVDAYTVPTPPRNLVPAP